MKISKMIENLQKFMAEHGDLDCWYASDDEGNSYQEVYNAPSKYYVNEDSEVYQLVDLEYFGIDVNEVKSICIVN